MLHKRSEEIIELVMLIEKVERTTWEFRHYLFGEVYLQLLPHYEVHEGTDQHPRLVLGGLNIDHCAVNELHHLFEQPIGILVELLEKDFIAHIEHWMMSSIFILHEECIPLGHYLVGQVVKGWRVQSELQTLHNIKCTLVIFIYKSWISQTVHELLVEQANS